jgi:hypothetical protein
VTSLTLITVVIIAYGALGPHGYARALALGGATAAGATIVVGAVAVPTFYATALGTVVALGFQLLHNGRDAGVARSRLPPGVSLLLLFLGWSVLVTVVAPELFDGLVVFLPNGKGVLTAGVITSSNIAQMVYLALGVCVVVFLARSPYAGPGLIGLAAGATTLLSLWRYLHQEVSVPFPDGVFDNSPNLAHIETAAGGVQRFRGILSEPSSLAASSLVTMSYLTSRIPRLAGWRRVGAMFVVAVAGYLGVISTSASFVVAGVVVAVIAAVAFLLGFLTRRRFVSAAVGVVSCAVIVTSLWLLPIIADFVQATINTKVASSSYGERSGANAASYGIFFDTYGLGTGLGANRASSFFAGLLSTTGLIGTLVFAAAIAGLVYRGGSVPAYRPVVWALVAMLVLKVTAGPDLSDTTGIMWMALGLLSRAALIAQEEAGSDAGVTTAPPVAPDAAWSRR